MKDGNDLNPVLKQIQSIRNQSIRVGINRSEPKIEEQTLMQK